MSYGVHVSPKMLCVLLCLLLTCNVDSVRLRVYIQREIYVVSIVSGFEYMYRERERETARVVPDTIVKKN